MSTRLNQPSNIWRPVLAAFILLLTSFVAADDLTEATAVIRSVTDSLLKQLENRDLYEKDKLRFYRMLENEILKEVDMALMSKLILRDHWQSATEQQQQQFLHGFKSMLLESYGKSILLLSDIEIRFIKPQETQGRRKYQIVRTQVLTDANAPPLSIDYYLIKREQWKIFDLVIDGLSLVKQFRHSFSEEVAESSFNALITRLNNNFQNF